MGMQTIGRTFTARPAQHINVFQHKTFQFNGKSHRTVCLSRGDDDDLSNIQNLFSPPKTDGGGAYAIVIFAHYETLETESESSGCLEIAWFTERSATFLSATIFAG